MNTLVSRAIVALTLLLVCLPFGQVLVVPVGIAKLNLSDAIMVMLVGLLSWLALLNGVRRRFGILLVMWSAVSVSYFLASWALWNAPIKESLTQYMFFLPFSVALFILAVPIDGLVDQYIPTLVAATALSAAGALTINFLFPGFVAASFASNPSVSDAILEGGRLYWGNVLAVFVPLGIVLYKDHAGIGTWMALSVAAVAALATVNRTVMLGCLLLVTSKVVSDRRAGIIERIRLFLAVAGALIVVGLVLYQASDKFASLIDLRLFGRGDLSAVYESAVVEGRLSNYEQYWRSLSSHFPLGQGLGRPLSTGPAGDVFSTDISALSFMLPFGIAGIGVVVAVIWAMWRETVGAVVTTPWGHTLRVLLPQLLLVFSVMSLNIDIFSRNVAIVWMAMLIALLNGTNEPTVSPVTN